MEGGNDDSDPNHKTVPLSFASEWVIWQLVDSALPTGGFVHSNGLEVAVQSGLVRGAESLFAYLKQFTQQTGALLLPFVNSAFADPCMDNWIRCDRRCQAMMLNPIAQRASAMQGRGLLKVAFCFPALKSRATQIQAELSRNRSVNGHVAPLFGFLLRELDVDSNRIRFMFLFLTVRAQISAAVRLSIIGPLEGQSLQLQLQPYAEAVAFESRDRLLEHAAQTCPLLELLQSNHDRLYSRLFNS
eukprot:GILJ01008253.1.p2 GENE.GILJ01008253.1~~GILJ01008253.1.p2  ORF type:complete len:244 (-),score=35.92 GILJ01008253.1:1124-1855(-)